LTTRHLAIAALVVLLVSAQLTWWTIFTIRESRARLDLEHQHLTWNCRCATQNLAKALTAATSQLEMPAPDSPDEAGALTSAPLLRGAHVVEDEKCSQGWRSEDDTLLYHTRRDGQCVEAALIPLSELHIIPPDIQLANEGTDLPSLSLPEPFAGIRLSPTRESWQQPGNRHKARLRMFVSEGSFFAALVIVLLTLLAKTMRRDIELERQHRNFISAITHELKSPLAAMRLSLETVLKGRCDEALSQRFLDNALQDCQRLEDLVHKVLQVTRFGRQDAVLTQQQIDLSAVVLDTCETFQRKASVSGVNLDATVLPNVQVRANAEAWEIVVSNLLENAVKYGSDEPEVRVDFRLTDGQAMLEVSDNGGGILEEDRPFVFDRFFRGCNEMTRTTQGTGLGLYLVRQIVTAHGGHIEIAATSPEGTTIRVTLPNATQHEDVS